MGKGSLLDFGKVHTFVRCLPLEIKYKCSNNSLYKGIPTGKAFMAALTNYAYNFSCAVVLHRITLQSGRVGAVWSYFLNSSFLGGDGDLNNSRQHSSDSPSESYLHKNNKQTVISANHQHVVKELFYDGALQDND